MKCTTSTKKFSLISLLFLFLAPGIPAAIAQQKTLLTAQIRKDFKAINNEKGLKEIVLNNEDFLDHMPDGGGKLTGYYKNKELIKIICWIGLSYGTQLTEYYFKDKELIFAYKVFNSFLYDDQTQQLRYNDTKRSFEGRYYFNGGQQIKTITKGKNNVDEGQTASENTMIQEADDYRKMLATHKIQ
ncbi:hypothetical protein ACSBL2_15640 [Pedobacter sp. AW31-3R]|uniref:hypothetical protein n=1 Tax=Pedobacter sp. AW31-3R TaxID=3445781 RepID=UPI003FA0F277